MRVCAEGLLRARHTVLSLSPFGVGVCLSSAQALTDGAEAVVLPSPATRDGVHIAGTDIPFSSLSFRAEQRVFGGFLPSAWKKDGVPLLDLSHSESFQLKNAALTAEGAIATALSASGRGFYGLSLAIVGYGRIGRLLAARLSGFGVPITVYARRKETRTEAALAGYKTHPLGEDTVFSESVLFNTVPEHVFARARARGVVNEFFLSLDVDLSDVVAVFFNSLQLRGDVGVIVKETVIGHNSEEVVKDRFGCIVIGRVKRAVFVEELAVGSCRHPNAVLIGGGDPSAKIDVRGGVRLNRHKRLVSVVSGGCGGVSGREVVCVALECKNIERGVVAHKQSGDVIAVIFKLFLDNGNGLEASAR